MMNTDHSTNDDDLWTDRPVGEKHFQKSDKIEHEIDRVDHPRPDEHVPV